MKTVTLGEEGFKIPGKVIPYKEACLLIGDVKITVKPYLDESRIGGTFRDMILTTTDKEFYLIYNDEEKKV